MGMLVAFGPWIVFAILAASASVAMGAWAAFAVALVLAVRGARHGAPKRLDIGGAVFFLAAGVSATLEPDLVTLATARIGSDLALLAIVLISLALGKPFTLAYARERTPRELWDNPIFLMVNRRISWAWAAAFAAMAATTAAWLRWPLLPGWWLIVVVVAALAGAVLFTLWYPAAVRRRFGQAP